MRGKAAQSMYLAVSLAMASLRKIDRFMVNARQEPRTGRWYVLRTPRAPENSKLPIGATGYADDLDKIENPPPRNR